MTAWLMIAVTVGLIAYDIYAYVGPERTISRVMAEFAAKRPYIVLAWGVLMGHWFWPIYIVSCP